MSKHVIIKTEFTDVKAVIAALTKLGLEHKVNGKVVTVNKHAHGYEAWVDLIIDCGTGQVHVDDMRKDVMQKVTQQYAYVKTVEQVKQLGFNIGEEKTTNGEIIFVANRWVS